MLKLKKAAAVAGITAATLGAGGMAASSASASTATPATAHHSTTPKGSDYTCSYYGWGWTYNWGYSDGIYGYWDFYYLGNHPYFC
jgi:hypothetical protein